MFVGIVPPKSASWRTRFLMDANQVSWWRPISHLLLDQLRTQSCRPRSRGMHAVSRRVQQMDEFKLLMALRTAFGPDSLLCNFSSPEGLCYDWLQFKSQEPEQPFRAFVGLLMSWEAAQTPDPRARSLLCERIDAFFLQLGENGSPSRPSKSDESQLLRSTCCSFRRDLAVPQPPSARSASLLEGVEVDLVVVPQLEVLIGRQVHSTGAASTQDVSASEMAEPSTAEPSRHSVIGRRCRNFLISVRGRSATTLRRAGLSVGRGCSSRPCTHGIGSPSDAIMAASSSPASRSVFTRARIESQQFRKQTISSSLRPRQVGRRRVCPRARSRSARLSPCQWTHSRSPAPSHVPEALA